MQQYLYSHRCWLAVLSATLYALLGHGMGTRSLVADERLETASAKLFTARPEALFLIEEGLQKDPQREDYWFALLRSLEVDSASPFVLAGYAHAALEANPNSLPLHWEWIRILPPPAGLDEMAVLAPREKNLTRMLDARSVLTLGGHLPRSGPEVKFFEQWATLLVRAEHWGHAKHVIKQGRRMFPQSQTLRICEAMHLIHLDKFEEAVAIVEDLNYLQTLEMPGLSKYPNVSDALLLKKQPKLAVRAYGTQPDEKLIAGRDGLLLGQALLLIDEPDRAEHIFEKTDKLGAHLLVIANLLSLKKKEEAHAVAQEMMNAWGSRDRAQFTPSTKSDLANAGAWPRALQPELALAIAWLYEEYPKRHSELDQNIVRKPFSTHRDYPFVRGFQAQRKELLEKHMPANILALHATGAGANFELAARDCREFLVNPQARVLPYDPQQPKIRPASDEEEEKAPIEQLLDMGHNWRLNQLRSASVAYYRTHLTELIAARQLLSNLKATRWNHPKIKEQNWLIDDEVVARASKLDDKFLPFVVEGLEPHVISGQDRTPWIQIIAKLGNQADVPVLVKTLTLIAKDHERNPRVPDEQELNRLRDLATLDALNIALEQLTGEKFTGKMATDRAEFWQKWWRENYARVVRGK